jgi:hypothetical protein
MRIVGGQYDVVAASAIYDRRDITVPQLGAPPVKARFWRAEIEHCEGVVRNRDKAGIVGEVGQVLVRTRLLQVLKIPAFGAAVEPRREAGSAWLWQCMCAGEQGWY